MIPETKARHDRAVEEIAKILARFAAKVGMSKLDGDFQLEGLLKASIPGIPLLWSHPDVNLDVVQRVAAGGALGEMVREVLSKNQIPKVEFRSEHDRTGRFQICVDFVYPNILVEKKKDGKETRGAGRRSASSSTDAEVFSVDEL